jgi:hypothetical protein
MAKIFVTIWDHRHGIDVGAYSTYERAVEEMNRIGEEWWADSVGGPKPEKDIGERYFEAMGDVSPGEYFSINEVEVV